jgi:very-short-patch-repair endonuclease
MEDLPTDRIMTYAELRADGLSRAGLRSALRDGVLRRARRDVYLAGGVSDRAFAAQRVGGRLDCVSVLTELGVFVLDARPLHVQVEPNRARQRSPHSRRARMPRDGSIVLHWRSEDLGDAHAVAVVSALASAVQCQPPRAAVATLDSALHCGLIAEGDLGEIFAAVPRKYRVLLPLVDGRAEAGSETIARLLMRGLGLRVEVQKVIEGVGRVDLVVDGWLVIECDSRAHHGGWIAQERDRQRDLALAERGYVCIRPTARMIFSQPDQLLRSVRGLLQGRHAR